MLNLAWFMKKKLFLFTADFPYGTGETFLESEIHYLAKGFDEINIISQNLTSTICRKLPENCSVERLNLNLSAIQKTGSVFGLFSPFVWQELRIIRKSYKIPVSSGILKTMLISLKRAKKVSEKAVQLTQNEPSSKKLYFYSYWCDDVALGIAMTQKKHKQISSFSRAHGWDVHFEASVLNYLSYRHFIANNLKMIFPISEQGKDYIDQTWKVNNSENVCVSRLGVVRQKMVIPNSEKFILVSCSNVIPLKRVDLIVRALAELKEIQLTWVHFGDGSKLEESKTLAKEILPATIAVDFKGQLSNCDVLTWYRENNPNLFINVSTTEGIPVSIMEAMSFGIPVIATDVGGTSEIVNEWNGVLLPSDLGKNELVSTILSFIKVDGLHQSKKEAAYNVWEEKLNAEKNYNAFTNTISQI